MNWSEFFAMGGYAPFVWSVYGLAALVLGYNVAQPLLRRRIVRRQLRDYLKLKSRSS
jgi:heme exporter protein CcmD